MSKHRLILVVFSLLAVISLIGVLYSPRSATVWFPGSIVFPRSSPTMTSNGTSDPNMTVSYSITPTATATNSDLFYSSNATDSVSLLDPDESAATTTADTEPECGYLVRSPWPPYSRLGNNMFVYASFYGLVKRQARMGANKTVFFQVDVHPNYLDDIFENLTLPQRVIEDDSWFSERNFSELKEVSCCRYDGRGLERLACDGENIYIRGYRCSFKYFLEVQDEIRREFTFKRPLNEKCETVVIDAFARRGLSRNNCIAVGVHLRRGDFVPKNLNDTTFYYTPAKLEYLKKAVRFHESRIMLNDEIRTNTSESGPCLAFLIFGDDKNWNAEAIKSVQLLRPKDTHLILMNSKHEPAIDLCAMSLCDHMSLSVGTFGWWGGFFSPGIVTYQKEFAAAMASDFEPKDYFLPHWIAL